MVKSSPRPSLLTSFYEKILTEPDVEHITALISNNKTLPNSFIKKVIYHTEEGKKRKEYVKHPK